MPAAAGIPFLIRLVYQCDLAGAGAGAAEGAVESGSQAAGIEQESQQPIELTKEEGSAE